VTPGRHASSITVRPPSPHRGQTSDFQGPRTTLPHPCQLGSSCVPCSPTRRPSTTAPIGEAAGLKSGTVPPLLARLESIRWVESRWEDVDRRTPGRPALRYYRITADGAEQAPHGARPDPTAAAQRLAPRQLPRHVIMRPQTTGRVRWVRVTPTANVLIHVAVRVLTPGATRDRHRTEHDAELPPLPTGRQVPYAGGLEGQAPRPAPPTTEVASEPRHG
jgi:hypothetical protein